MCRIYGYISDKFITSDVLDKVAFQQLSGGPDEQGRVQKLGWGIGNNRLAIQGIRGGKQPFHLKGIYCVFNGEIYNHDKLRAILRHKGYQLDDTCDGSIIPALYHAYGKDFVKKLDGMFAIAIVDTITQEKPKLLLFSDPVGIKSVYFTFSSTEKVFAFSSEIPSLFEFGVSSKSIRPEAINEYLSGRAIWGQCTIFNDVQQLKPSSILTISLDSSPCHEYYKSDLDAEICAYSLEEAGETLDLMLQDEVKQMLCADVPPCIVTSGGLDSSYLTALASKFSPNIHSFNVAYAGKWPFDERAYAKKVARQYGAHYHQVEIEENEFPFLLEKMIRHIGQPNNAPHCISTYALFAAVKEHGFKFALTGEGADEMFGGYKRFATATFDNEPNWMDSYLDQMSAVNKSDRWDIYSEEYKTVLGYKELHVDTCKAILLALQERYGKLDAILRFDQDYRFPYYILRRVDHLSMANSIEVRVPFCQTRIRALSRKLPMNYKLDNTRVKKILYAAAIDKLDGSILNRPKQPFTLPITAMLQEGHPLMRIVQETLCSESFLKRNVFKKEYVTRLIANQLNNPNNISSGTLWSLMVLELWMQMNSINFKLD